MAFSSVQCGCVGVGDRGGGGGGGSMTLCVFVCKRMCWGGVVGGGEAAWTEGGGREGSVGGGRRKAGRGGACRASQGEP